ncbi:beta-ketoacyl synthase N-terminal-like domain-containing protein [Streptomyces sp. NPDC020490]|uniref:beta-ketoacyl synthase N-terminal-like domain-containing protein n=1 Tax=Streptomyces sp. NPDC020490 TaxID=3365078 RepID=UPI0037B71F81
MEDPDAALLGVDRRVLRTTEKQARLALLGARLTKVAAPGVRGERCGLFLGLPTVDQELLALKHADALRAVAGSPDEVARLYSRATPPFGALEHLNSTAAAHVSAAHGLTGATAVYAPFSDAGLNALVDGVLSVAEGESDAALVGAVAPRIHPLLPLRYRALGWLGGPLGEATAFLMAERSTADAPGVRLAGYARGFAPDPAARSTALAAVARRAIRMAGTHADGIGWVLTDGALTEEAARAQESALHYVFIGVDRPPPAVGTEDRLGNTGPAQPLIHALLGMRALETGRCLSPGTSGLVEAPMPRPRVLLLAAGPLGQVGAVVLSTKSGAPS